MSTQNNDFILRMLERLDEKMDDLIQRQAEHKTTLDVHVKTEEDLQARNQTILSKHSDHIAEYNEQLKEHMRRTDLLEKRVEPLEHDLELRNLKQSFIAAHWKKISLVFGIIGAAAGAIWSGVQIWAKFTGKM